MKLPGPEDALVMEQMTRRLYEGGWSVRISTTGAGYLAWALATFNNGTPALDEECAPIECDGETMLEAVRKVYEAVVRVSLRAHAATRATYPK